VGSVQTYKCSDCGLSAMVSGGGDRGKYAFSQTIYCNDCNILADATTDHQAYLNVSGCPTCEKIWLSRFSDEADFSDPDLSQKWHQMTPVCPKCHGKSIKLWSEGNPCPKCGGRLEEDPEGKSALWD